VLFTVLLAAVPCVSCTAQRSRQPAGGGRFFDAYREGVTEATREIREGRPTIHVFGLHPQTGRDGETGLPCRAVATDAVDPATIWRVRGHNDAVRAWLGKPLSTTPLGQ
jgi:hypothetical protein